MRVAIESMLPSDCQAGDLALARGAWSDAREAYESALAVQESPEALEGLGLAAWWLDLADIVFDSRERSYRLFLARDDRVSAARLAVWLAWDYWAFHGEHAVANGWLQRARRHLADQPPCPEHARLESREGALALFDDNDPDRAFAHAGAAIAAAQAAGSIDLEMLGRALQGLALVSSGAVAEGMRGLDEVNAAVVGGELTDLVAIGLASCYMIAACDRVRDYDRAAQWCTRLKAFSAKWGLRPLFAVCRTQYASICMWRGTWLEAEQELAAATEELSASRPGMVADGLVHLAELRRRQGRLVEAAAMFEQCESHGLAVLGRAELALDRGEALTAAEMAERFLRKVPAHNRTNRASGLDLLIRARLAAGDREGAKTALVELDTIASLVATVPLRAAANLAAGRQALADGREDAAQRHCEDAVDGYLQSGAPFELALARMELARALGARSRHEEAAQEVNRAIEILTELKAEFEISRARTLLASLALSGPAPARQTAAAASGLTRRELEVLRLVATGCNNQRIAEQLFVSEHTVHRHVANILSKLNVSSRAAAVAQAARRGLLS